MLILGMNEQHTYRHRFISTSRLRLTVNTFSLDTINPSEHKSDEYLSHHTPACTLSIGMHRSPPVSRQPKGI